MKKIIIALSISVSLLTAAEQPKSPVPSTKTEAAKAPFKGVELTVGQLIAIKQSQVIEKLKSQDLPAVTAYRIERLSVIIKPEADRAAAAREALFTDQNSTTDKNGIKSIKPENLAAFMATQKPLLEEKVPISGVTTLTIEDLAEAKLSAFDIENLGPLIDTGK